MKGEIVETDATTAEMVKLMENTYRDVNIAIANEFSRLAEQFGVDVWEAIALANRHPRVNILSPGPGVGGHCISVDPWFLVEAAPELTPLIASGAPGERLLSQPSSWISCGERLARSRGKRIAALGLAYKPDVDDLRESPAAEVVRLLQAEGARGSRLGAVQAGWPASRHHAGRGLRRGAVAARMQSSCWLRTPNSASLHPADVAAKDARARAR